MKISVFLFAAILLISCGSEDMEPQNDLVGKWKLIEVYSDPGDGSGTYNPVESDKTVEFKNNGRFISNGKMCYIEIEPTEGSKGSYSIEDNTLTPDNCEIEFNLPFELNGNKLTISYFCIEGCGEKYEKVN